MSHAPTGLTVEELSRQLKIGRRWLVSQLERSKFVPTWHPDPLRPERKRGYYPAKCLPWLKRRLKAFRSIPLLGTYKTLPQAAEELGRSREWIHETIAAYDLPRIARRRTHNNRLVACLSPTAIRRLQRLQAPLPDPTWLNAHQLHLLTGWPAEYVTRRLTKANVVSEARRSAETGHPSTYYPPEATKLLGRPPDCQAPGGSWLTATYMADKLGRSYDWMKCRLPSYRHLAEWRWDDVGVRRLHYPPSVLTALEQQSMPQAA